MTPSSCLQNAREDIDKALGLLKPLSSTFSSSADVSSLVSVCSTLALLKSMHVQIQASSITMEPLGDEQVEDMLHTLQTKADRINDQVC